MQYIDTSSYIHFFNKTKDMMEARRPDPGVIHYVKRKTGQFEEPYLWGCNSLRAGWATCQAIARISA